MKQIVFTVIWLLVGCGTKVEVGRNASYQPGADERTTDGFDSNDPTLTDGPGASGTCFAQGDDLPAAYQHFCSKTADTEAMADLERIVCKEKKVSNLWRTNCGWDGVNLAERSRYFRTLEHTSVEDKGGIFHYIGAYSLSFANTGGLESFMKLVIQAHGNTSEFLQKYKLPDSTTITPVYWEPSDTNPLAKYRINVETSIGRTLNYMGQMHGFRDNETSLELLQAYLVSSEPHQNISTSSTVIFSGFAEDGVYKIVALEHRVIPDLGLHDIAWDTARKSDFNRMRLYYEYTIK
jgi:hypothetical protein